MLKVSLTIALSEHEYKYIAIFIFNFIRKSDFVNHLEI